MAISVNIDGVGRNVPTPQVNIDGIWRDVDVVQNNIDGVWKTSYPDYFIITADNRGMIGYTDETTELTIPDFFYNNGIKYKVIAIGESAFYRCYSLESIIISNSITVIGVKSFRNCNLLNVTIGNNVTHIQDDAFSFCQKLESIVIPNNVIDIGARAFDYCSTLSSIEIGNGVQRIGSAAFSDCFALTSINISSNVTSLGNNDDGGYGINVFQGCSKLTGINVDINNPQYTSINGVLFTKDMKTILCYPAANPNTSYIIPDGVTIIENYAFNKISLLRSITIPNSVTNIKHHAFYYCHFNSISIPDSVTSIDKYAFMSCYMLNTITIGISVTSIGDEAFYDCESLTTVNFRGTEEQWNAISIGTSNEALTNANIVFNYTD